MTFVDIPTAQVAHGVEPRPEVGVKSYDPRVDAQIHMEIVEVCRLYDDADLELEFVHK